MAVAARRSACLGTWAVVCTLVNIELDDRPGVLRDFVQKAQKDLIKNIEKAAKIAVEEGHFRGDLDTEMFAWSTYSFVLGYHHFNRMLEDPKAESHLKRSFKGLLDMARGSSGAPAKTGKKKNGNRK